LTWNHKPLKRETMKLHQLLTIASTATLVFLAPAHAGAQTAALADDTFVETVSDSLLRAEAAYAAGRFGDAFGFYYWAAIRDNARAQEMVGLMLLPGTGLYGAAVTADRDDALFWLRQAASRGRDTAAHLAQALARQATASMTTRTATAN
jgi:TPR repeat protein